MAPPKTWLALMGWRDSFGDVERLAPQLSDGEMPEEEPEEGEGDGCDEPKAPKWWDQSRALNKAHKALVQTYDKLHENAKAELKKMQDLHKQYQKCSVKERQQMAGDAQILQTRMMCLEKVFDTAESLQGFINGFDATPVPDSASLTSDSMGLLGKAAPCANFCKLKVFRDLRSDIEKTWECKTLEELEAHKSSWGDLKAPVSDLVAACKSAGSDLSRSFKAVQKAQSQIQAAKAKPAKKGATAGTSGVGAKLEAVEQICLCSPSQCSQVGARQQTLSRAYRDFQGNVHENGFNPLTDSRCGNGCSSGLESCLGSSSGHRAEERDQGVVRETFRRPGVLDCIHVFHSLLG